MFDKLKQALASVSSDFLPHVILPGSYMDNKRPAVAIKLSGFEGL
jgi:hypothetical protein